MATKTKRKAKRKASRRRRFTSSVRRRASSTRRRVTRFGRSKKGKSIIGMITTFIPPIASIQLLSFNQTNALPAGASVGDKVKAVVNGVTGSIFDFNIFDDAPKAHVHFDIEGAFNHWTAIASVAWIGGSIGQRVGLPSSGVFKTLGKKLFIPAVVAGSLGLKNNNPVGGKSNPFFTSGSTQSNPQLLPPISNGGGVA